MAGALKAPPTELTSVGLQRIGQLTPAGHAELRVDALQVVVHGADRQEQPLGDGLARLALRGERGDVALAGGERHDHDERRSGPASGHPRSVPASAVARTPSVAAARRSPCRWNACAASVADSAASSRAPSPLEAIGHLDERIRQARGRGCRMRSRRRRRGRLRTAPRARRDGRRRRPGRRDGRHRGGATPLVIRYPLAVASSAAARSTSRAPGRSPVATSAHARPSSCSAGSNRNAGRRSNSSTAAAAAAASPRLA